MLLLIYLDLFKPVFFTYNRHPDYLIKAVINMVVIRLSRGGAKKRPFYKIVVADSRAPRDGAYLEHLGYFNPIAIGGEKRIEIDRERLTHWLSNGAQPSDRVRSILRELDNPGLVDKRKAKKAARKLKQKEKAKAEADAKVQAEAKPEEPVAEESK